MCGLCTCDCLHAGGRTASHRIQSITTGMLHRRLIYHSHRTANHHQNHPMFLGVSWRPREPPPLSQCCLVPNRRGTATGSATFRSVTRPSHRPRTPRESLPSMLERRTGDSRLIQERGRPEGAGAGAVLEQEEEQEQEHQEPETAPDRK